MIFLHVPLLQLEARSEFPPLIRERASFVLLVIEDKHFFYSSEELFILPAHARKLLSPLWMDLSG